MRSCGLVLFACAGLMLSGGTILCGSAAFCLFRMSYYFWTTDLGVELSCGLLLMAGAMLCLPICWLCTVVPYHPKSGHLLGTLLVLTTSSLMLLSLGMSSLTDLSRALREPAAVNASMLRAMAQTHIDTNIRSSFAAMQLELHCCGVNSYSDWHQYRRSLPPACCGRDWTGKNTAQCSTPHYNVGGCLRPALTQLRSYSNSMAVLASVVISILAVVLFAASYTLADVVVVAREARKPPAPPLSQPAPLRVHCLPHSLLHGPPAPFSNSPSLATTLLPPPSTPALTHI